MDEDLTMLIGPARDGTPLGIGVLDLSSNDAVVIHAMRLPPSSTCSSGRGDPMRHTDAEIEEAASRFEQLAENLDPATAAAEDLSDLRAVAEAADKVRRDEALVTERVAAARARGRSWNKIAVALGVSRQAARHRFADKIAAGRARPGS
jgi:hypothetical protein